MIRRPPRSTQSRSSAASDVYERIGESIEFQTGAPYQKALFGMCKSSVRPCLPIGNRKQLHSGTNLHAPGTILSHQIKDTLTESRGIGLLGMGRQAC